MSRSSISTSIYSASAMTQVADALPRMYRVNDAIMAGMTSARLQGLAGAPSIIGVEALPDWAKVLPATTQAAIIDPDARLGAIDDLMKPIAIAEAMITTQAVTDSLAAEGFMTRTVVEGSLGIVEARRGHEIVLVEVNGSQVTRDRAGLDDETCATSDTAFEAQMAKRGIRLVVEKVTEHKSIAGGELIRTAAGRNRRNLAEGAAQASRAGNVTKARKAVTR